jgi:hypothetical protein
MRCKGITFATWLARFRRDYVETIIDASRVPDRPYTRKNVKELIQIVREETVQRGRPVKIPGTGTIIEWPENSEEEPERIKGADQILLHGLGVEWGD